MMKIPKPKMVNASLKVDQAFMTVLKKRAADQKENNFSRFLNQLIEKGLKYDQDIKLFSQKVNKPENFRVRTFFEKHKGKKAKFKLQDGKELVIVINTIEDAHEVNYLANEAYNQLLKHYNKQLYFIE